ncbi:MAG: STN domain-containing protein, partial [Stenotrophomonas maltophilia]
MRISTRAGHHPRPSRLCIALLTAGLAAAPALPALALAQSGPTSAASTLRFDIPAQPLSDALRAYMRQSGVQVAYPAALAEGVISSPVTGQMDAPAALLRLLQGSGLSMRQVGPDAVTLERAAVAASDDGLIVTDALSVAGDRIDGGSDAERALDVYRTAGSSAYIARATIERFRGTSTA